MVLGAKDELCLPESSATVEFWKVISDLVVRERPHIPSFKGLSVSNQCTSSSSIHCGLLEEGRAVDEPTSSQAVDSDSPLVTSRLKSSPYLMKQKTKSSFALVPVTFRSRFQRRVDEWDGESSLTKEEWSQKP